jgi:hypothetical protein
LIARRIGLVRGLVEALDLSIASHNPFVSQFRRLKCFIEPLLQNHLSASGWLLDGEQLLAHGFLPLIGAGRRASPATSHLL